MNSNVLFLANSTVNLFLSQLLLANPQLCLGTVLRLPNVSRTAIAMARYRGLLHLSSTIQSMTAMARHDHRNQANRTMALGLALSGLAHCCLDWVLVWSGVWMMLPFAILDGILVAANLSFYCSCFFM